MRLVRMRKGKNDIIAQFRELPLDIRLEEAIRTFEEYERLQKKWKSVLDKLALSSDKYKEATSKKKLSERIIERFVDMFEKYMEGYMKVPLSEEKKDELRKMVEEVLNEDEE